MDQAKIASKNSSYSREVVSAQLAKYEALTSELSQRRTAEIIKIPRTTLQHWDKRKKNIPLNKPAVNFFESPDGTDFLHRLITSLLFVMTEMGGCGIRLVSLLLDLTHLSHFVSSSYETLRKRAIELENNIVSYGKDELKKRGEGMAEKKISIAEDETFHPQPCLVAIEPVSNFILLEKYSTKRTAVSWNIAMDYALSDLNVNIIQSTADEAGGIINHVEQHLGARHSPDLFHVQYDISRGCSASMRARTSHAEKSLKDAVQALEVRQAHEVSPFSGRGRRVKALSLTLSTAKKKKVDAERNLEYSKEQQEKISSSNRGLGRDYHPYSIKTGKAQNTEKIEALLTKHFSCIEETAKENNIKESGLKKVAKAKRMLPKLVSTIGFNWLMITSLLDSLMLEVEVETLMKDYFFPIAYLKIASKKAKGAEQRKDIYDVANALQKDLEKINAGNSYPKKKRSY